MIPARLFIDDRPSVCAACRKRFKPHKRSYAVDGVVFHVLYEYEEWIETLFFQYKEQRDVALKDVFLEGEASALRRKLRSFQCVAVCSSEAKRAERGFEPVLDIFSSLNLPLESPFYRVGSQKQSTLSASARRSIQMVLRRKRHYPLPPAKKRILLDDVLTTGSTIQAALTLLPCEAVLVVAAHPLWIQTHRHERIKSRFWK